MEHSPSEVLIALQHELRHTRAACKCGVQPELVMAVAERNFEGVSRRRLLTGGLAGGFLLAFHLPLRALEDVLFHGILTHKPIDMYMRSLTNAVSARNRQ